MNTTEQNSSQQMRLVVERITPEQAAKMLQKNIEGNRKLRPSVVKALANDIKTGDWKVTHQGLAISTSGVLLDGQHRLQAIIQSGVPADLAVIYGCPDESFDVIDSGLSRSVADRLMVNRGVVAVSKFLHLLINPGSQRASSAVLKHYLAKFGRLTEELVNEHPINKPKLTNQRVRAAVVVLAAEGSRDYVFRAYGQIISEEKCLFAPLAVQAWSRQVLTTGNTLGRNNYMEDFLRALIAFEPDNAGMTRILLRNYDFHLSLAQKRVQRLLYKSDLL